jgi:hypothetical protein
VPTKPTPNWRIWSKRISAPLVEAVALSCDLDPEDPTVAAWMRMEWQAVTTGELNALDLAAHKVPSAEDQDFADALVEFKDRLSIAVDHARHSRLKVDPSSVGFPVVLADFSTWWIGLHGKESPLPPLFPSPTTPPGETPDLTATAGAWPWGAYETNELRIMAKAGQYFFSKPRKEAPPKKEVAVWLVENGIEAKRTADVMAQILLGK